MTQKLQILLVEDQAVARLPVQAILNSLECDVKFAENGAQALKLAAENHFDLVFMDIGLPDINGFDVTKGIRALAAPYGAVPIVALTAHDDAETEKSAREAGMNAFFTKPLTPDVANIALKKFCGVHTKQK